MSSRAARPDRSEAVPAVGLALLGTYLLLDARTIAIPASEQSIGPRFFPYVVGGAMVLVGLWLLVAVLRGDRAESEGGEDVEVGASTDWRTLLPMVAAFAAYIALLQPLGYVLATVLLFGTVAWALGSRNYRLLLLLAVLVPLLTYLLFTRALGVYLPNGILEGVV